MKDTVPRVKVVHSQSFIFSFVSVLLIASAALAIALFVQQRNVTLKAAMDALSSDASETVDSLDTALGIANATLEKAKSDFVPEWVTGQEKTKLTAIAFQIRWVQNAYLLDENGRLIDSAFPRVAPVLALGDGLLYQLRNGKDSACKILDAPTESGKALVLVKVLRRDFPMRYCAIVFSGFESQGRYAEILSPSERVMALVDESGDYYISGSPKALMEHPSRFLKTSIPLSGWPVSLSLAEDREQLCRDCSSRASFGRRFSLASSK